MFIVGVVYSAGCRFCVDLVDPSGNSIWDKFTKLLRNKLNNTLGKNKYKIVKVESHNKDNDPHTARVKVEGVPTVFKYTDNGEIDYFPPQARTVHSLLSWATKGLPTNTHHKTVKGGKRLGRKRAKKTSRRNASCKTCKSTIDLFALFRK